MSFLRTHIENRSIFMLMLITLLCITLIFVSTLIHAAGPLLIAGVPAAIFIKKAVGVGLAGLTIWGAAEMLKKNLDEAISGLEDSIINLAVAKQKAKNAKENAKKEVDKRKVQYDAAKTALSTAETNLSTAEANTANAKSAYDQSVHYENWAYNNYMTHGASCSQCSGSMRCPEGQRLYNNWQSYKAQASADKVTWNKAKATEKTRKKELSDAKLHHYTVEGDYNMWKWGLEVATNTYNWNSTELTTKTADLAAKRVEKSINEATIQNAMGQTSSAMATLDDAETNYPNAWSEAMGDTDLAAQVQAVRDSWNEMNGGQ